MNRHIISAFSIIALIAAALTGCNGDIFVDGEELPEETGKIIEGDHGHFSLALSRKELKKVIIEHTAEDAEYFRYYGEESRPVPPDCPASELRQIDFENGLQMFTLSLSGDILDFRSYYNCSGRDNSVTVRLEFDYGVKYIYIVILPGKQLEPIFTDYDSGSKFDVTDNFDRVTRTISYTNDGPIPQTVYVQPYINARAQSQVMPDESWAKGISLDMPLISYFDGHWGLMESADVHLGSVYLPPVWEKDLKVKIEIPANSSVRIVSTVNYSQATGRGKILMRNPSADTNFDLPFTSTTIYPVSYDIRIEDAE